MKAVESVTGCVAASERNLTFIRALKTGSRALALSLVLALAPSSSALADSIASEDIADLAEMDTEDLFDIEITSLTKSSQRLSETPAAIYVVTNEDIRRSGVRGFRRHCGWSPAFR